MMNKFYIRKIGNRFVSIDGRNIREYIQELREGVYSILFTEERKARSNRQNAYLFGCVYPLIFPYLIDAGWKLTTLEEVHYFCLTRFTAVDCINSHTGEIIRFPPTSSSKMNTVQFNTYLDLLIEFALEAFELEIPPPDREWFKNEMSDM